MVLGIEFLLAHHDILMLAINCLMIMGGDLCVVLIQNKKPKETRLISILQFKKGVNQHEPSFMVVLMGDKEGEEEDMPQIIQDV